MNSLGSLIRLARPHQYVKNVFVLMPLFFAGGILETDRLVPAVLAFLAFSFVASGIYVLNDLKDIQEDRLHPAKQARPLAAGEVSVSVAWGMSIALLGVGFVLMFFVSVTSAAILLLYVLMNIGYSLGLKRVALLDVGFIAIGFVLRLFVGSAASEVPLSQWIVVTTFLLALFLALAKRRDDLIIHSQTGEEVRIASKGYNLEMINSAITLLAAAILVAYLQYTTSTEVVSRLGSDHLYLTTLFVVMGVLRYLQITFVYQQSGSPTLVVLRDRFTQINLLCWVLTFGFLLYV